VTAGRGLSPEAQAVLDAAACGLMQTAEDGTFLRVNRTFCQWVGREAADLVGGQRFQDLLTVGGRIFHQTHWAPLLRMQGSVSEVKLQVRHRDGSVIPMMLNAIRHDQDGVIVHEIAAYVARDRDRFEQELVRSRARLEELVAVANQLEADAKDRALLAEQMIGIVSHDLRNPLAAISMAATMLARGHLPPVEQRYVERIGRATDRATRLISDLLDFTRARLGNGLPIAPVAIDLHAVIADSVEELRLSPPASALVHVRHGEAACRADPHRLAQLLGNLVANAVTYGDPRVPVTVTSRVDATSFAIGVHNAGPPIAVEAQAGLFEPMTRGTAGGKADSVGLGLFIVREIARAHGGEVRVRSSAADGTTFEVVVPHAPAPP
jgi:sigma-B regulation protein RsbU (phosphoserine phosphatase)